MSQTNDPTQSADGRWPDFLVIGAMKSGSSTLWTYLSLHPGVFMCRPKEPQFFSRDHVFANGVDWYRGLFAEARPDQVCGEASVCYTRYPRYPESAARVAAHVPDAKLIYVVRDPAERALSHYRHNMQRRWIRGDETVGFDEAVDDDPSILSAGLYVEQMQRFLEYFSQDALKCVLFEDLVRDPMVVLNECAGLIGVDAEPFREIKPKRVNEWGDEIARNRIKKAINQVRGSSFRSLFRFIPKPIRGGTIGILRGSRLKRLLVTRELDRMRAAQDSHLDVDASRAYLRDYYAEPNIAFRTFMGRKRLGWWDDPTESPSHEEGGNS